MKKGKKIHIILDDICESLDLKAIGIRLGDENNGCKVLLTVRSRDVLSCMMDSHQIFLAHLLDGKEA